MSDSGAAKLKVHVCVCVYIYVCVCVCVDANVHLPACCGTFCAMLLQACIDLLFAALLLWPCGSSSSVTLTHINTNSTTSHRIAGETSRRFVLELVLELGKGKGLGNDSDASGLRRLRASLHSTI